MYGFFRKARSIIWIAGQLAVFLGLASCGGERGVTPASTALLTATPGVEPTNIPKRTVAPMTATPVSSQPTTPEMSAAETGWKDFMIGDFEAVHSRVNGDTNEHLIFGAIEISRPTEGLPAGLAKMLGRWEGYDYSPPVKKDNKGVLVIQQIDERGGKAYLYAASILQYPTWVKQINFRVIPGTIPAIEWIGDFGIDAQGRIDRRIIRLTYDAERDVLHGIFLNLNGRTLANQIELTRNSSFYIYRDYPGYLASKRIYNQEYRNSTLQKYGWGYLYYLPEGYEAETQRKWPLILFLCGTGERGENAFRLAKHGPWNWILQKGALPFIIVAPMLHESDDYRSFPETYLSGALDEILADYRIDPKRIYLTGLSMGGEATYRFALYRPEVFAAIAPFAAFEPRFSSWAQAEGFKSSELPLRRLKDVPVWAFHGAKDPIVPLADAQKIVEALKQAGVDVHFTVLAEHDHDSWSEAFLSQAFYDWLLAQKLE